MKWKPKEMTGFFRGTFLIPCQKFIDFIMVKSALKGTDVFDGQYLPLHGGSPTKCVQEFTLN